MTDSAITIGAIESTGEHKGEIYGGIWSKEFGGDNKPIWFSQFATKLMNYFDAAAWAKEQGGDLPSRKQGKYLDSIKDKGAFKDIFNRNDSYPDGYIWLADPDITTKYNGWSQRITTGFQINFLRKSALPVLSVQR